MPKRIHRERIKIEEAPMDKKLFEILENFRPCFSRKASYYWFILVMIGLVVRADHYGISSIVRWVSLKP